MRLRSFFLFACIGLVHCGSCTKTAELAPEDAGVSIADAATSSTTDGGSSSTKGKPRNLSVEHGTVGLRTKLNACYTAALATHPDEKGGTELSIFIAADGHVKEARVTGSTLSNETLDCLRHTAEAYTFDPLDKDTGIMIPLFFGPKADGGADAPDGGVRGRRRDAGAPLPSSSGS